MRLLAYTASKSFRQFLAAQLDVEIEFFEALSAPPTNLRGVCLLHISSFGAAAPGWLQRHAASSRLAIAVCADRPDVVEMLECVRLGAKGYCNSHMQAALYQQMLRLLDDGQSWFAPDLLQQTFAIAQTALAGKDTDRLLQDLTAREKQIALAVAEGKSNRQIAVQMSISEPTVKTHLTRIFRKLELKDRVALALLLS